MPGAVDDDNDDGNDDEGIFFDFKKQCLYDWRAKKYCNFERKNVFYAITACMTPGDFFF